MIKVDNLCKSFNYYEKGEGLRSGIANMFKRELKSKDVVKSISFTIQDGEKVGLIGPNGAGKTTTMKFAHGNFISNQRNRRGYGIYSMETGKGV